jgi:drug/metabolite transporter (DMT)-like permease
MSLLQILGIIVVVLGLVLTVTGGVSNLLIVGAGVLLFTLAVTRKRHKAKFGGPTRLR